MVGERNMNRVRCDICGDDTVLRIPTMVLRWAVTHFKINGHSHFKAAFVDMPDVNFEIKLIQLTKTELQNDKITKWIKKGEFYSG